MPELLHSAVPPSENHPVVSWIVADPAALAALTPTSADVHKVAFVASTSTYYALVGHSPISWTLLNATPVNAVVSVSQAGEDLTFTFADGTTQVITVSSGGSGSVAVTSDPYSGRCVVGDSIFYVPVVPDGGPNEEDTWFVGLELHLSSGGNIDYTPEGAIEFSEEFTGGDIDPIYIGGMRSLVGGADGWYSAVKQHDGKIQFFSSDALVEAPQDVFLPTSPLVVTAGVHLTYPDYNWSFQNMSFAEVALLRIDAAKLGGRTLDEVRLRVWRRSSNGTYSSLINVSSDGSPAVGSIQFYLN